jgi:hypothetical protein
MNPAGRSTASLPAIENLLVEIRVSWVEMGGDWRAMENAKCRMKMPRDGNGRLHELQELRGYMSGAVRFDAPGCETVLRIVVPRGGEGARPRAHFELEAEEGFAY